MNRGHHHSIHQATKVMHLQEVILKVSPDMVRCLVRCQARCQVSINNTHKQAMECQVSQEPCQECQVAKCQACQEQQRVKCHQAMVNKFQVTNNHFSKTNNSDLVG